MSTAAQLPRPDVRPQVINDQDYTVREITSGRSCRAGLPRPCIRDSTVAAESSETHPASVVFADEHVHALETA